MGFKSKAQMARAAEHVKQGKMSQQVFDAHAAETPSHVPERSAPVKQHKRSKSVGVVKLAKVIGVKKS